MKLKRIFTLIVDMKKAASAFNYTIEDVKAELENGVERSWKAERMIANREGFQKPHSRQLAYDVIQHKTQKWEIRSIRQNICFAPSGTVGSGRKFSLGALRGKLNELLISDGGYLLVDNPVYSKDKAYMQVYRVPAEHVLTLLKQQRLTKKGTITRKRLLEE